MIEKMKFLSITGPKTDIDRVVNTYLSKYRNPSGKSPLRTDLQSKVFLPFMKSIIIRKHLPLPTVSMKS